MRITRQHVIAILSAIGALVIGDVTGFVDLLVTVLSRNV